MRLIKHRILFEYFILAVCGLRVTLGQSPSSPCPEVFSYQQDAGRWYGYITGRSSVYGDEIKTVIKMEYDGILGSGDIKNINRLTSDAELRDVVARGGSLRYRLDINVNPLPRVIEIEFNGRILCESSRDESRLGDLTMLRREHTLYPNGERRGNSTTTKRVRPITEYVTQVMQTTPTTERVRPPGATRVPSAVCGVQDTPTFQPTKLIAQGIPTEPGDWPWLVALFHGGINGLKFQCGASLLGKLFIITAAHCLYDHTGQLVDNENIVIIAGASDVSLRTYSEEYRSLSAAYVHEEYNTKTNLNDIALLVLRKPVTHSKLIKPICLWEGDDDQNDLVGNNGMVVGWGDTGSGPSLEAPLRVAVPIVSLTTCRGENSRFYDLTNDNSICAGKKGKGKGPCKGDSGSGLYVQQNRRWRLRGVVSVSLETICGPDTYVVYTDVAKFKDWIDHKTFNH